MITFAKKLGIMMLSATTAIAPLTTAAYAGGDSDAWQREWNNPDAQVYQYRNREYRGQRHEYRDYRGQRQVYRGRRNDDAIALGIIGLGVGAIIGGAIANSQNNPRVIYRPAPVARDYYPAAPRVVNDGGRFEPWTKSWFRYCSNKYRSFDPSSGTYRGYDGRDHFCSVN